MLPFGQRQKRGRAKEGDTMEDGLERAMEDKHPKRYNHGSPNAGASLLETLPFRLQHDEKIVRELKPQFFGFMMTRAFGSYLIIFALIVLSTIALIVLRTSISSYLVYIFLLPLFIAFLITIISIKPFIEYGKSWYWITNHRVIGKRGFLGYSINSIPLENVSDIVLMRTLLDRFLGLSSLIIVSMGSSSQIVGGMNDENAQSPNFFPALTQETARELQRVLFNMRDDLKTPKAEDLVAKVTQVTKSNHRPKGYQRMGGSATQASIQPRLISSPNS
jgi:membrane protein YdbS with pleckstrin-like domain